LLSQRPSGVFSTSIALAPVNLVGKEKPPKGASSRGEGGVVIFRISQVLFEFFLAHIVRLFPRSRNLTSKLILADKTFIKFTVSVKHFPQLSIGVLPAALKI